MGNPSAAATGLTSAVPSRGIARHAFATPRPEIDALCLLTLKGYLRHACPNTAAVEALFDPECPSIDARAAELQHIRQTLARVTVIDPACGGGDMLTGMLERIDRTRCHLAQLLGIEEDRAILRQSVARNLFGIDIDLQAVTQARAQLHAVSGCHPQGLNIMHGDALLEYRPWANCDTHAAWPREFQLVIGNPPYVRHERIADPFRAVPAALYKQAVFAITREHIQALLEDLPEDLPSDAIPVVALDGRSDLCVLFTFLCFRLRARGGALGLVLPRSLFDTRYGGAVQHFLSHSGLDVTSIESRLHRSFPTAGVNTCLLIARPASGAASPQRLLADPSISRESIGAGMCRHVSQRGGHPESCATAIVAKVATRTVPLREIGHLRYAVKTGINQFFYPDLGLQQRFGLDPEFLLPALRSPRSVRRIALHSDESDAHVFVCCADRDSLARNGKSGTLAYIAWGERQQTRRGIPWPSVPSVRGRSPWYALSPPPPAHILCPRFFDRRFFFPVLRGPMHEDQTFYGFCLPCADLEMRDIVAAMLNSSLSLLMIELNGRSGLGEGVRQYALCDMKQHQILDPRTIPAGLRTSLVRAFRTLSVRDIYPLEEEMQQVDRQELDSLIAHAAQLDIRSMQEVRQALVRLANMRRTRARSGIRSRRTWQEC